MTGNIPGTNWDKNKRYNYVLDFSTGGTEVDGTGNYKYEDSDFPIYLFGMYKVTKVDLWHGRIYNVSITKGTEEIMHLVPCKKNNNSGVEMFDMLGNKYYPLERGVAGPPASN